MQKVCTVSLHLAVCYAVNLIGLVLSDYEMTSTQVSNYGFLEGS